MTRQEANRRDASPLLEIIDLKTHFLLQEGVVRAVDGVSFRIDPGRVVGIVGESGCGKSVLARSILLLVQWPGRIVGGQILYRTPGGATDGSDPVDLCTLSPGGKEIRRIRGGDIAMVFQEPMASLSLVHTVGSQIVEGILLHQSVTKKEAVERAIYMLDRVGIPDPERRVHEYPFRLSGGMRQRAMIAMALANNPKLLIADEPTTALDVTTQAQILQLMLEVQREFGMAMMLITHNLGVIAQMADEVVVMYLGKVVEQADVRTLFREPSHPYTQELLKSIPRLGRSRQKTRLSTIRGSVPLGYEKVSGCIFHPRCPRSIHGLCEVREPSDVEIAPGHAAACWLYADRPGAMEN